MLRNLIMPFFLVLWALPALAQGGAARIEPLYKALGLAEIVSIMRDEGLDYGEELAAELFATAAGPGWTRLVEEIYSQPRLEQIVRTQLAADLQGRELDSILAFFDSPLGQRIIRLEIGARQAMLDPDVEDASHEALAEMIRRDDPRLKMIKEFAETNALIENNVVGAMNSNYAFYLGLSEGGAFDESFSEEDMLADVWSQEDVIRGETSEWLFGYLVMAYEPLTDDELTAYIEFSRTRSGQVLNQAIFNAFDRMFVNVSLALGHSAARFMVAQEL